MRRHGPHAEEGAAEADAAPTPDTPTAAPSDDPGALEPVQPSAQRFVQLTMYAFASFMCAMDWTILVRASARGAACAARRGGALSARGRVAQAPVYQLGEERFHVGLQRINSLSNVRRPPPHAPPRQRPDPAAADSAAVLRRRAAPPRPVRRAAAL